MDVLLFSPGLKGIDFTPCAKTDIPFPFLSPLVLQGIDFTGQRFVFFIQTNQQLEGGLGVKPLPRTEGVFGRILGVTSISPFLPGIRFSF